jgi:glyoxylase-like metal-dependent hydrolase (beta-lactamase superfamily II)
MPLDSIRLNRRLFLVAGAGTLVLPALGRRTWALATGTHRHMQGAVEVTVLSDGTLTLPLSILAPTAPKEEFEALVTEMFGAVPETFSPATNITLLRSGSDLILVDTGSGKGFQPTAGKLMESLAANDIDPGAITKVVFTHAHPDHVWGTVAEGGGLHFPNAAYYVGAAEWDFWMNPDIFTQLPAEMHPFAQGAQRDLGAVKDRVTMVKGGDAIAPGIEVLDTPGHTPGHISLFVADGGGLIVTGDVTPSEVLSLRHPDWPFGFDAVPELAVATRRSLLDRAATDGATLLGYHFAYPGVGKVEKQGDAFHFTAM